MPKASKPPVAVLYGPDTKYGAVVRKTFSRYVWYVRWYDESGKREQSLGVEYGGDVDSALAQWTQSRQEEKRRVALTGGPRQPHEITCGEVLDYYGEKHAPHVASPERIGYAMKALDPFWRNLRVSDVTASRRREYEADREVASATVRRELGALDAACRFCVAENKLTSYPSDVWLPDKGDARKRFLTNSEVLRLLAAARSMTRSRTHLRLFILIGLFTGRRKRAILDLQWAPSETGGFVDLDNEVIDFLPVGAAETSKVKGRIFIPSRLIKPLWFARAKTRKYVIEYKGNGTMDIQTAFDEAVSIAGLGDDVTPHTLRHTCVTNGLRRGWPIWDVGNFVGMSPEMVERTYGHHIPDRRIDISSRRR